MKLLARLLRFAADRLSLLADVGHRAAERIAPSIKPASDYVELCEGLQREALTDHNQQVARDLYQIGCDDRGFYLRKVPQLTVIRGGRAA